MAYTITNNNYYQQFKSVAYLKIESSNDSVYTIIEHKYLNLQKIVGLIISVIISHSNFIFTIAYAFTLFIFADLQCRTAVIIRGARRNFSKGGKHFTKIFILFA